VFVLLIRDWFFSLKGQKQEVKKALTVKKANVFEISMNFV
jgi:hypothetical protein